MAEPARVEGHGSQAGAHRRVVEANSGGDFREALDDFLELKKMVAAREGDRALHDQPQMVSRFYDVVTRFYEYGWGQSFHFAPRRSGEGLHAAQRRQEAAMAELLGLGPGTKVADIGCGVGGPLVSVAQVTGASVTGVNLNAEQVAKGRRAIRRAGLEGTCDVMLANYLDVPLEDGFFDAAYSYEAICHAPDKDLCFRELFRLIRPGGQVALTEWCLTERFDGGDSTHRDIRDRVEFANATPNLLTTVAHVEAIEQAGFEVLLAKDQALESAPGWPWYRALQGRDFSLASLARVPAGRWFTATLTGLLERLRIVPGGTSEAARILNGAADALVESGKAGIFTPCFLVHARKPGGDASSPS